MPTSEQRLYVWVWLPGATEPVVAGAVQARGDQIVFNYGSSYLNREEAIPLYEPELPLQPGLIRPLRGLQVAGCIRDAAPDSWGQRVILYRLTGEASRDVDTAELDLLTYLIEAGSERVGALDFQHSATEYVARIGGGTLEEMLEAVARLEAGEPLSEDVERALVAGSSLGGARPKVLIRDGDRQLIAKLSAPTDSYAIVKAETAAMDLARRVGLDIPDTEYTQVMGRDVLLVERFDRTETPGNRRMVVSALTILELDEFRGARYASYPALADEIRKRFTAPEATLRELYSRLVFNICVGNTDDHARNHAAFWDGRQLTLAPAFDICPQLRIGGEASQSMALDRDGLRLSSLEAAVQTAHFYLLDEKEARAIIDHQLDVIRREWSEAAQRAEMTAADRDALWERAILNPYVLEGYE